MKAGDIFTIIQHAVDSGLRPGASMFMNLEPESEITFAQAITFIDAAVKLQKLHQENLAREAADFPMAGDNIPMTFEQKTSIYKYVQRLGFNPLEFGSSRIQALSYNDVMSRIARFLEIHPRKGMTPEEVDELYAYARSRGYQGGDLYKDLTGMTLEEGKAAIDAVRSIADRTDSAYGTVPGM